MFSLDRIIPLARRYRELRRKKNEVLDLSPTIRSWVPVDIADAPATLSAVEGFPDWYQATATPAPPIRDQRPIAKRPPAILACFVAGSASF